MVAAAALIALPLFVQQFGAGNNWPFGSALAGAMMVAMLVCLVAFAALVMRHPALRQAGRGSAR